MQKWVFLELDQSTAVSGMWASVCSSLKQPLMVARWLLPLQPSLLCSRQELGWADRSALSFHQGILEASSIFSFVSVG